MRLQIEIKNMYMPWQVRYSAKLIIVNSYHPMLTSGFIFIYI